MEAVQLRNINKFYKADGFTFHALKDISISISKGEFVSVMGPSGSGKTTMLDIIGCISTPTSGEYYLDGKRVDKLNSRELALTRNRKIGFIFQNFNLIPQYNLKENIELPLTYSGIDKKDRKELVVNALSVVGLEGKGKRFPNQLSGGEKQRVAIARALINKPSILLADEPTGNLDSKTGEEILSVFRVLHESGNTIVLITHDSKIAQYASRTYFMKDGELLEHK